MAGGGSTAPDLRARETEAWMTDDERFALLVSVMGASAFMPVRDDRIPAGVPMCAGYVPGVPRLGVPALLMSDASLGVTNPGYRDGAPGQPDTGCVVQSGAGASLGRHDRPRSPEPGIQCAARGRHQPRQGS